MENFEAIVIPDFITEFFLMILLRTITKFSVQDENLETIIDMQSWSKT